jgi:hypothetical protein
MRRLRSARAWYMRVICLSESVCICVSLCILECMCVCVCIYIYIYMHVRMYAYIYIYICVYLCEYVCIGTERHRGSWGARACACAEGLNICAYAYADYDIRTQTNMHIYIYIYIHTYIHTCIQMGFSTYDPKKKTLSASQEDALCLSVCLSSHTCAHDLSSNSARTTHKTRLRRPLMGRARRCCRTRVLPACLSCCFRASVKMKIYVCVYAYIYIYKYMYMCVYI